LNGHDHLYERFAPQTPDLLSDPSRGIRQFTVGTGGAPLYSRAAVAPNSEVLIQSFGVLRMSLQPSLYEWEFIDANGVAVDRGLNICH
jgi:hypothetical protein